MLVAAMLLAACAAQTDDVPDAIGDSSLTRPSAPPSTTAAEPIEPYVEREAGCLDTVRSLPNPRSDEPAVNPVEALRDGQIAPLPRPGYDRPVLDPGPELTTPDQFIDYYPNLVAPQDRRRALIDAGFERDMGADFIVGDEHYGVQLVQFATADGAAHYYREHVQRTCRDAVDLEEVEVAPGAVVYWRDTGERSVPRALAVVGRTEIALTLCYCLAAGDPAELIRDWLTSVIAQLDGGPASAT
jgi:hypothetical protein